MRAVTDGAKRKDAIPRVCFALRYGDADPGAACIGRCVAYCVDRAFGVYGIERTNPNAGIAFRQNNGPRRNRV